MRVTGGGMLGARVLAALLRVRREPNFHRNNDRKLGEGMQGCGSCELFRFFACGKARLGGKSAERKQVVCGFFMSWLKPRPTKNLERNVKTRTLQRPKSAAPGKDKRLLQSGGRLSHPPWLKKETCGVSGSAQSVKMLQARSNYPRFRIGLPSRGGALMLKAKRIRYAPIAAGTPEIGRSIQCQPSRTASAKSYIVPTNMIMPTDRTKEN